MKAFFSLEAIISLIFALLILSIFSSVRFFEDDSSLFYLCSDAAILISKNPEQEYIKKIAEESEICIEIDNFTNCPRKVNSEIISFTFPIYKAEKIQKTTLSCFRK
jgi:hypothetical protein